VVIICIPQLAKIFEVHRNTNDEDFDKINNKTCGLQKFSLKLRNTNENDLDKINSKTCGLQIFSLIEEYK
jgi:hypothetical protein